MSNLVEMKIYVSEGTRHAIQTELEHCGCSASSFIRTAILKEIVYRTQMRHQTQPKQELPGQLAFGRDG